MDFAAVLGQRMRREKQIPLRLSNSEYAAIEAKAHADGRSMAGLIRHAVGSWLRASNETPPAAASHGKGSAHDAGGIVPAPKIELDAGEDRSA